MNHRHLLPQEIDLLLDGDSGFGVQPLRAHVRECGECRAELDAARELVAALEHVPHFTPSSRFAERVMQQVQVFEPWHVTARDTARQWLPRSRPAQVLAGAMAASAAFVLSLGAFWLLVRADMLVFVSGSLAERGRGVVSAALAEAITAAFGEGAGAALGGGGATGLAIALTGLLATIVASAFGLRVVAAVARRRRSA